MACTNHEFPGYSGRGFERKRNQQYKVVGLGEGAASLTGVGCWWLKGGLEVGKRGLVTLAGSELHAKLQWGLANPKSLGPEGVQISEVHMVSMIEALWSFQLYNTKIFIKKGPQKC